MLPNLHRLLCSNWILAVTAVMEWLKLRSASPLPLCVVDVADPMSGQIVSLQLGLGGLARYRVLQAAVEILRVQTRQIALHRGSRCWPQKSVALHPPIVGPHLRLSHQLPMAPYTTLKHL
jgi:hypothetical protein